jgi:GDP-L-fucose synthase
MTELISDAPGSETKSTWQGRLAWQGALGQTCVGDRGRQLSDLVLTLHQNGADVFVPRHPDYDLVQLPAVRDLLSDARPKVIFHLAARVGGIGANLAHPGGFFYDNLMMGAQLLHEAWRSGVAKFVALGTVCAYPKLRPLSARTICGTATEETNAPYGLARRCCWCNRGPIARNTAF